MQYLHENIITPEGVEKVRVYKIIWVQWLDWNIVNSRVFDWEYTQNELLIQVNNAKQQLEQMNNFVSEIEWKSPVTITQTDIDLALVKKQAELELEAIKKEKANQINKIATITDQLNLTAWTLDIIVDLLAINNPELLNNPWIIKSKQALNWIKEILKS